MPRKLFIQTPSAFLQEFWRHVSKPPPSWTWCKDDCWLWTGPLRCYIPVLNGIYSTRVIGVLHTGELVGKIYRDKSKCTVSRCINPAHFHPFCDRSKWKPKPVMSALIERMYKDERTNSIELVQYTRELKLSMQTVRAAFAEWQLSRIQQLVQYYLTNKLDFRKAL